jgi:hypothetical protein
LFLFASNTALFICFDSSILRTPRGISSGK